LDQFFQGRPTLLGVGSELSISGESDLVQAIRESAQSNVARAGDQITQRNLDIQPTITIRPGAPVRVLVTRDIVFRQRNTRSYADRQTIPTDECLRRSRS
jgi:type IV secretory pathway VirB10-like protein